MVDPSSRERAPLSSSLPSHRYFTEMCSGSDTGSYLRLIDFVHHSSLGLRVIKKKRRRVAIQGRQGWSGDGAGAAPLRGRERRFAAPRHHAGARERARERECVCVCKRERELTQLGEGVVRSPCHAPHLHPGNLFIYSSSSLLLSSLDLSDTQSLWALNTSPPRNRCTSFNTNRLVNGFPALIKCI